MTEYQWFPVTSRSIKCPPEWFPHLQAFIAYLQLRKLSPGTITARSFHLRRVANDLGKPPFDVTVDDLMVWLAGKRIATETQASYVNSIVMFYQWAVKTGRIEKSPAEDLPRGGQRITRRSPSQRTTTASHSLMRPTNASGG